MTTVVGILGGTFDPVHLGHLDLAQRVRRGLELPAVALLPAATPPHKRAHDVTPAHHREAMLRLAIVDQPGLEICTYELEQDAVAYTIDTLRAVRAGPPARDPIFILGTDTLTDLHTWRNWEALVREFDLVAMDRAGHEVGTARDLMKPELAARIIQLAAPLDRRRLDALAPGRGGRIFHLPGVPIPISSSETRAVAAAGGDLTGLVPPAVAEYIQRAGPYRREDRR